MLDQLRNLSNPPGAFGIDQAAVFGLAVFSILLLFAGPLLWAIISLLNERSGRAMNQAQPVQKTDAETDHDHIKAA